MLAARGHEVVATTRSATKAKLLRAAGATAVVVDGLDAAAIGEVVARAEPDAIVHQMSALGGAPDMRRFDRWFAATNALRTRGTENLLAAARASGVGRFVAQSYTGWTNAHDGSPVKTEEDALDPRPARSQRETFAAVRYLERAVLGAPLQGTILRYGNFYGPEASEALLGLVRRRRLPIIGTGAGVWSWIHVDDAAAATVAAVERGPRGVFNVVDDEPAPVSEWLPFLAEVLGAPAPRRIPRWLGYLAAGEAATRWMTEGRGASNRRARWELAWEPRWRSWREGFRSGLSDRPMAGAGSQGPHAGGGFDGAPSQPAHDPRTPNGPQRPQGAE